jgi:hypothetical protein
MSSSKVLVAQNQETRVIPIERHTTVVLPGMPPDTKVLPVDRRKAVLVKPNLRSVILATNAGTPGASGIGADAHFVFTQAEPSSKWTIKHNLEKFPSVTVFNSANEQVEGEVKHLSNKELTVEFPSGGFSGVAYMN